MAKALNFNTIKKQYFTVTLADDKKTTIMVGTPTKEIMDELINIQDNLEAYEDDENNTEALNDLYLVCVKIMNRNKGGIKIDKKYLEKIFDFEDIKIFINAYMEFIDEVMSAKN